MLRTPRPTAASPSRICTKRGGFHAETLGVRTSEEHDQMWLHLANGRDTLAYQQPDATPASYTS